LRDERTTLKVFASEPNTRAAHDEFVGTGGSLYYLNHSDVVLGSAKLLVEVRDRHSLRVREQQLLIEGQDYKIDEFQGRVILSRPLRSTANMSVLSVIREAPLDGDDVVLVIDYEYISRGLLTDELTAGVRAKQWVTDNIAIGGTYVNEESGDSAFRIKGLDFTYKVSEQTHITLEVSSTDAAQNIDFALSVDGGLDFVTQNPPTRDISGDAVALNARLALEDVGLPDLGTVGVWYRDQDAGFDSVQFKNSTARDVRTYGVESILTPSDRLTVRGKFEKRELGSGTSAQDLGVQLDWQVSGKTRVSGEFLYQDDKTATADINSSTIGGRVSRNVSEKLSTFVNVQVALDDSDGGRVDDLLGFGFEYWATDNWEFRGEAFSDGDDSGARLSVGYKIRDESTAYLNYTTDSSSDRRRGLTLGQKTKLTNRLSVYSEHRFDRSGKENVEGNSYGISYDFTRNWTVDTDFLRGVTETKDGSSFDRIAYSLTSRYRTDKMELVNRLEYRNDQNARPTDRDQWVTVNLLRYQYTDDWTLIGKIDYSESKEQGINATDAKFGEIDLGFAYRPVSSDRLNLLAMYSYVYDLDPTNQNGGLFLDEKGHVLSLEGIYRVSPRWSIGGKIAWKESAIRVDRDDGKFFDTSTQLYIGRARYHIIDKWDGLAEYRWLEADQGDDRKQGILLGFDYHLKKNLKVGVGYNFTDFNDKLTNLDYEARGWFINLLGKY